MLSLVVPVYNVAQYLPEFLGSLAGQTVPLDQIEIVFVDDGSADGSGGLVADWCAQHAPHAEVLVQPNRGPAAARNAGLERVTRAWVSFPDSDDRLAPNYLDEALRFLRSEECSEVRLVSANVVLLQDSGDVVDRHPLRAKFTKGNQVVDLDRHPDYIQLQACSAFFRMDTIRTAGLRWDERVRPTFEDALFIALYLGSGPRPLVGCLATATYHYRRRSDGLSLVQRSWSMPDKYTRVPRFGHLALARHFAAKGPVPLWVQNTILYDLQHYFREDERWRSATAWLPDEVVAAFYDVVAETMTYIDPETVDGFRIAWLSPALRNSLKIAFHGVGRRPSTLAVHRIDVSQHICQVRYFYGGELPAEEFRVRGVAIRPVYGKVRDLTYFGRVLAHERIVWIPATGTIRIALDGTALPLTLGPPGIPTYVLRPAEMWRKLARRPSPAEVPQTTPRRTSTWRRRRARLTRRLRRARPLLATVANSVRSLVPGTSEYVERAPQRLRRRAKSVPVRRSYADAWIFMDREMQANDNAEHLYRHVRRAHPEVNAWFALSRRCPDWDRLRADGFRLVEYGSAEFAMLVLNAQHMLSSQADDYVVRPLDVSTYGWPAWRFTFLQHGVNHNDLSRWVNLKPIHLFLTSTERELRDIAGDHTAYVFTTKEVRLTGLPRHDRLWRLAREVDQRDVRLVLIMPTWRRGLLDDLAEAPELRREQFWRTAYMQAWVSLMESADVRGALQRAGLRLVFVPHPNLAELVADDRLPSHVQIANYGSSDVQQLFARCALLVTDYSSNAFEMAYLRRPVIYYHFDGGGFYDGTHMVRRGTWTHERDGFGPVTSTVSELLGELGKLIANGLEPTEPYLGRMQDAFPIRDGQCCERVYHEVVRLSRPVPRHIAYRPAERPAPPVVPG